MEPISGGLKVSCKKKQLSTCNFLLDSITSLGVKIHTIQNGAHTGKSQKFIICQCVFTVTQQTQAHLSYIKKAMTVVTTCTCIVNKNYVMNKH